MSEQPEWKEWKNTQEQRDEMGNCKHGYILRSPNGSEGPIHLSKNAYILTKFTHYLICKPLPHASIRARHAKTGQPVWVKDHKINEWIPIRNPSFSTHHEYTMTPPNQEG